MLSSGCVESWLPSVSVAGVSLMLVWSLLHTACLGVGCPYEDCFCEEVVVVCENHRLTSMVTPLGTDNTYFLVLVLDNNSIRNIPAGTVLANLSEVSIKENPLEEIDPAAFDLSLNTLQTLTFSAARFHQIPEAVLHLPNLANLSLSDTNITSWQEDSLRKLGQNLHKLVLQAVGLTNWPNWLSSFSQLTQLTLSGNNIQTVPDEAFDTMANTLVSLDLSNNSLPTVPTAVSKLTVLETLLLHKNRITDISGLPPLSQISLLFLNGNRISNSIVLSTKLQRYSATLNTLMINDNQLTAIPNLDFLTKVLDLDFSNNLISDPHSGSVPQTLYDLKLDNNLLPSIPSIFKTMKSVPTLVLTNNRISSLQGQDFPVTSGVDLESNLITELTDTSFPTNSNITLLVLNSNPLSWLSPGAFQNLPRLAELNLKNTRLTRLPVAIASLTQLVEIDVSDNTDLVCTCQEKAIQPIIRAMIAPNVLGDCGHISVYVFFTEFSGDCPSTYDHYKVF